MFSHYRKYSAAKKKYSAAKQLYSYKLRLLSRQVKLISNFKRRMRIIPYVKCGFTSSIKGVEESIAAVHRRLHFRLTFIAQYIVVVLPEVLPMNLVALLQLYPSKQNQTLPNLFVLRVPVMDFFFLLVVHVLFNLK